MIGGKQKVAGRDIVGNRAGLNPNRKCSQWFGEQLGYGASAKPSNGAFAPIDCDDRIANLKVLDRHLTLGSQNQRAVPETRNFRLQRCNGLVSNAVAVGVGL